MPGAAECTECAGAAGAADPARPSPARLSPRCWATSWHSLRRHRRCFSTASSLLSQRTPTPLSVHFVFHLPAGHARGFLQCHGGKGGERCQSCLCLPPEEAESLPLASSAGHGQRWTLGHRDRVGTNPRSLL